MNSETAPSATPRPPLYKRPLFWIFAVILLPPFLFALWRTLLAIEVSNKLDRIVAAGYPINGEQLNAFYKAAPESNNAAVVLLKAFAMRRVTEDQSNELLHITLIRDKPLSADDRDWLEEYVSINTNMLNTVREALQRTECRYPVDFRNGFNTKLPHLAKLKAIAQFLEYKARLAAESGRGHDAVQDIALIPALAQTLDGEPTMISQLVRIAGLAIGARGMEHCLGCCQLSEADLLELKDAFELKHTNRMVLGMIGARAEAIPCFRLSLSQVRSLISNDEDTPFASLGQMGQLNSPVSLLGATGFFERDLLFYLNAMDSCIRDWQLPPPQCLNAANNLEKKGKKAKRQYYIVSAILLPGFSRAVEKEVRITALLRLAQSAIAVERYRIAQGRLPDTLKDLVPKYLPAVPEDPFDGRPIRFKHLKTGYVLYSVGADGVDNGGKEWLTQDAAKKKNVPYKSKTECDDTFIVER